jgi:hypothetical protein
VSLKIAKGEQAPEITMNGMIRRVEEVGGRKDIVAVGIEFVGEPPMSYKLLINSFLAAGRKLGQDGVKQGPTKAHAAGPRTSDAGADQDGGQEKEPSDG